MNTMSKKVAIRKIAIHQKMTQAILPYIFLVRSNAWSKNSTFWREKKLIPNFQWVEFR